MVAEAVVALQAPIDPYGTRGQLPSGTVMPPTPSGETIMNAARALIAAVLLLAAPVGSVVTAQSAPDAARVDAIFERWHGAESPGCAVAVARDGRTVLARAYGMADLEHAIPNSPESIFEAGSVSKQFTAAAIMLLVQQGQLSLDDDIRQYVPEIPDYGTPIRIRHMLNHTSGLRDWGSVAAMSGWPRSHRTHTHEHVVDILSRQRGLNFEPGAAYSYSNSGYNLAAVIVERVSGISFAEFSRRYIFEPLGLVDTQWRDDYTRIVPGRATAYAARGDGFVIDRPIENVHGNGGLLTTVGDLLVWNESLASGKIGGRDFVRLMHEQGVLNDGRTIEYAAGISVGAFRGIPEVSHTGATSGYRAFLARYPDQAVGVAVLCNVGNVDPGSVGRRVGEVFLGGALAEVATPATQQAQQATEPYRPEADALAGLAGRYYSTDAETTLILSVADGQLVAERRPAARMIFNPVAPDAFASSLGRIRFVRNGSGAVTHFLVEQARVWSLQFDRQLP
jgi:CubicO group peptidase (beta-lactamase class C family)